MKKSLIHISLLAAGLLSLASCGSEEVLNGEDIQLPAEEGTRNSGENLESKTYSQESLVITYNGEVLLGKSATFVVGSAGEASIELAGDVLDLNSFIGGSEAMLPPVQTCGVFPGTPKFILNVQLSGSEDECSFEGVSETEYCTFSYQGSVNADVMMLNLFDVKLKDTTMADSSESLAWTWGLKAFDYNFYNVLRVVWESEKQIDIMEGFSMPISTIVSMALIMPMVNEMSVPELLTGNLKYVSFREDGNVIATYLNAETGEFVESPANIAQYVVKGDKIMFYLNPQAVMYHEMQKEQTRGESEADPITSAVNAIFSAVIPMASEGIPLTYGKAISGIADFETNEPSYFDYPQTMSVYLGTEVMLPLLKAVSPVIADESIQQLIIELATSTPGFEDMATMVEPIVKNLPEVIEKTSVVEVGINLERFTSNSVPTVRI